ncbi:MAG: NUDIX domain-containing protein [Treponema sp.]|nr:NUDIX domain-containing protein [Treponema sp.]
MKIIELINDDYIGCVKNLRHACRGIIIIGGNVLLCYESNEGKYIIPGGGQEGNESLEQCCKREIQEETGLIVNVKQAYLEIQELFLDWRHINHYYICDAIEDTGKVHLTEYEKQAGYKTVWLPLEKAIEIFGNYESFHKTNIADYGLYRREFHALSEAAKILKNRIKLK